jgi:hypothetical protein
MWLRMDHLPEFFGVQAPLAGDRAQLLSYLTEYALVVSGGALPPGRGREDFAKVCSRCHALPDPEAHSPQDWVAAAYNRESSCSDCHNQGQFCANCHLNAGLISPGRLRGAGWGAPRCAPLVMGRRFPSARATRSHGNTPGVPDRPTMISPSRE